VPQLLQPLDGEIVREVEDKEMKEHLVVKVNGQRIFCKGGNWGMDDAMKRVSRERLEPYFKLHKNMHYTMIRNWTGESTEEIFYELCDEYGILVFNDFWLSTEGFNLNPLDNTLLM
jgi:beta-galactosidase/beta-glucuronidase